MFELRLVKPTKVSEWLITGYVMRFKLHLVDCSATHQNVPQNNSLAHIPQFHLAHWGILNSGTTPDLIRVSSSRGHPRLDRRILGLEGEIATILRH
jgi:hypothetical protein